MAENGNTLADVHVHSDCSHRPEHILDATVEFGIKAFQGMTTKQIAETIQAGDTSGIGDVQTRWDTWYGRMVETRKAYVSPEAIGFLIEKIIEAAAAEGVDLIELRISLLSTVQALLANMGMDGDPAQFRHYAPRVMDAIINAAERTKGRIATDLVISISMQEKYAIYLKELKDICRTYKRHIIAIDLTNERGNQPTRYRKEIEWLRKHIRFLTIHTMEVMSPAARGWDALELEPDRIGHGIKAVDDPRIMEVIKNRGIPLEICPWSNVVTGTVASLEEHPMRQLFDEGLTLTVGSDGSNDGNGLVHTYDTIGRMGFTEEEIARLKQNSWDSAFRNMRR